LNVFYGFSLALFNVNKLSRALQKQALSRGSGYFSQRSSEWANHSRLRLLDEAFYKINFLHFLSQIL